MDPNDGGRRVVPVKTTDNGGYATAICYGTDANANATLYAAAPEMLEALEWIANGIVPGQDNMILFRKGMQVIARAALAKAKGE